MNLIRTWLLPLIIAIALVLIFRWLVFDFMIVPDNLMNNTLYKGDLVLIQKRAKIRRNNIVLLDTNLSPYSNSSRLSRCVALPGDTLQIINSWVYINRKRLDSDISARKKIISQYKYQTDSGNIQTTFTKNEITINKKTSVFGVYQFYSDRDRLKRIEDQVNWNNKQKIHTEKGLYDNNTAPFNTHFYWNTDNFGPLVIPAANKTIVLNSVSFALYKSIILKETGEKYQIKNKIVKLNGKIAKSYTFKNDYYFVLNDNFPIARDSRSFGFISRNEISGKFILKLF